MKLRSIFFLIYSLILLSAFTAIPKVSFASCAEELIKTQFVEEPTKHDFVMIDQSVYFDSKDRFEYKTHLLNEVERETQKVWVINGRFYNSAGHILTTSGSAMIVMDKLGRLYIFQRELLPENIRGRSYHHSSFLAGKAVAFAGKIIVRLGEVTYVNLNSGHYSPHDEFMSQIHKRFIELGIDTSEIAYKKHDDNLMTTLPEFSVTLKAIISEKNLMIKIQRMSKLTNDDFALLYDTLARADIHLIDGLNAKAEIVQLLIRKTDADFETVERLISDSNFKIRLYLFKALKSHHHLFKHEHKLIKRWINKGLEDENEEVRHAAHSLKELLMDNGLDLSQSTNP